MNDDSLQAIERQLARLAPASAPDALRAAVLGDVRRELRAARWDRRLARVAAALLVAGMGLNATIGMVSTDAVSQPQQRVAQAEQRRSLVDTAIVVAEATDAVTARRFARQLAAMSGRELTDAEEAAIDAAVKRPMSHTDTNGKRG